MERLVGEHQDLGVTDSTFWSKKVTKLPVPKGSDRQSDQRSDRLGRGLATALTEGQTNGQTMVKTFAKNGRSDQRSDQWSDQHISQSFTSRANIPTIQLNQNQYRVYKLLCNYEGPVVRVSEIASYLGLSPHTTRKIVRRLRKLEIIINFKTIRRATIQGFAFSINPNIRVLGTDITETNGLTFGRTDGQTIGRTVRPSVRPTVPSSSSIIKLLQIELEELYPNLCNAGFSNEHLDQIQRAWLLQGIDLEGLPDSLEKADWTLAHDTGKIENPLYYVLSPLKRGPFATPPGFKSRKVQALEQAAKQAAEEAKKIREIEEQRFEDEFLIWWTQLSEEEKEKVDSENTVLPKEGKLRTNFRKDWFRKHIFKPLV